METARYIHRRNNNLLLYVILVAIILFIAISYFSGCSTENDYEKGTELLKDKHYAAALDEFEEVDSDDPNYRMAQSKIHYIEGLLAFNDSLMQEAQVHLLKVETDDEYYHDSQLMLDKIQESLVYRNTRLAMLATKTGTDTTTIVVKEEIVQKQAPENRETLTRQSNRDHALQLERMISRFESIFQSSRAAPVSSKSSFLANMKTLENEFYSGSYNGSDQNIIALRNLISSWMWRLIQFVNQQIAENTVGETESSRHLRSEGDDLYFAVNNQLGKVKSAYAD